MRDKFLWNARHNGSMRASRIRNFTIDEDQGSFLVIAWVNDDESVKMGLMETEVKAQDFLEGLHKQVEAIE